MDPLYLSLAAKYRHLIVSGALKPGEMLPSVREVGLSMRLNPNTVSRAFRVLVEEGYLTSIEKKGYFVSERNAPSRRDALSSALDVLLSQGYTKEEILFELKNKEDKR